MPIDLSLALGTHFEWRETLTTPTSPAAMPLNPIAFTDRVVRSFLRYQLTAYPFADARLHRQMRDLLSLEKTRATPLLKGPYLTLSLPFENGCSVHQLIEEKLLHPLMRERIPEAIEHVYRH